MIRRAYRCQTAVKSGCGVVQGDNENTIKVGDGNFIGVYSFEGNEEKAKDDTVGIQLDEIPKVLAGGTVQAGKRAVLEADGSFIEMGTAAGKYNTCGVFLESGVKGEYVDMLIDRDTITIA